MMSVVLDDRHAASLAVYLKPPLGAVEAGKRLGDVTPADAELSAQCHSGQRIQHVVFTRNRKLELAEIDDLVCLPRLHPRGRSEPLHADIDCGDVSRAVQTIGNGWPLNLWPQFLEVRIIGAKNDDTAVSRYGVRELHEAR